MRYLKGVEVFLLSLAAKIPLGLFVIIGSLLEEIVAPIPSPLVMMTAGTVAQAQHRGFGYVILIGLLAAVSKTFGCWIFYFLADKAEDFITSRFGKLMGLSHKEIEDIGEMFNGEVRDEIILAVVRAIPIMPTTPVSLACGFIKMNLTRYLRGTFVGNFVRGMLFGYIGYSGLSILQSAISGINTAESWMNVVLVLLLVGFFAFVYFKRGKVDLRKWLVKKKKKI
ncbi:MAG: DedA family protein [Microgenomates group bacterium]